MIRILLPRYLTFIVEANFPSKVMSGLGYFAVKHRSVSTKVLKFETLSYVACTKLILVIAGGKRQATT